LQHPIGGIFYILLVKKGVIVMLDGCQGKPRTPTIIEKICPNCGAEIELFSIDTQMPCEKCGFIAYNDTLSCVQWCAYAKECVGEEMYEAMMKIAQQQKEQRRNKNAS
jgi:ribosomal protein S27AE